MIACILIDRDAGSDWLLSYLARSDRQLLLLYGRRRVEKTALVTIALEALDGETTTLMGRSDVHLFTPQRLGALFEGVRWFFALDL